MEKTALQKLIEQYKIKLNDTSLFIEKEIIKDLEIFLNEEREQIATAYKAGTFNFNEKALNISNDTSELFIKK